MFWGQVQVFDLKSIFPLQLDKFVQGLINSRGAHATQVLKTARTQTHAIRKIGTQKRTQIFCLKIFERK